MHIKFIWLDFVELYIINSFHEYIEANKLVVNICQADSSLFKINIYLLAVMIIINDFF